MKYVSIDLETTGLNPEKNQILTFSGVVEDTVKKLPFEDVPKLNVYILYEELTGSPFALNMNSKIVASISRYKTLKTEEERKGLRESLDGVFITQNCIPYYIYLWLLVNHEGKDEYKDLLNPSNWDNYGSAEIGIKAVSNIKQKEGRIKLNVAGKNFATFDKKFIDKVDRFYDLVTFRQRVLDPSVLFIDWKNDECAPDLAQCKQRAQIDGIVTHESIMDAWDVVELFRKSY